MAYCSASPQQTIAKFNLGHQLPAALQILGLQYSDCNGARGLLRLPGKMRGKNMEIQAFGYLGLGASNLDDWAAFATSTIGMQSVDRASSMRAFRMDDRKQRLFIDRTIEPGTQVFGWEVANAAVLDSLAARLEAAGVAVKREPAALADQRCVAD